MLTAQSDAEIRNSCRKRLEALELWLRRLIRDQLSVNGDPFVETGASGNRLIGKAISDKGATRHATEPIGIRERSMPCC